jgi:hypothetical protein
MGCGRGGNVLVDFELQDRIGFEVFIGFRMRMHERKCIRVVDTPSIDSRSISAKSEKMNLKFDSAACLLAAS